MKKKYQFAFVGLGSNMGQRLMYLRRAITLIQKADEIRVIHKSQIYVTSPMGPDQRDFYNAVIKIKTCFSPFQLLEKMQAIEVQLGRVRSVHWGPRVIDLDVLGYADQIIKSDLLTIPHPQIHLRKFVLYPFLDVAPDWVLPGMNRSIAQLSTELTDPDQKVRLLKINL